MELINKIMSWKCNQIILPVANVVYIYSNKLEWAMLK